MYVLACVCVCVCTSMCKSVLANVGNGGNQPASSNSIHDEEEDSASVGFHSTWVVVLQWWAGPGVTHHHPFLFARQGWELLTPTEPPDLALPEDQGGLLDYSVQNTVGSPNMSVDVALARHSSWPGRPSSSQQRKHG